jgi:PH and SEC7 domain-containing protein
MSKAQFVRNTLQVLQESETSLPSSNRGSDYDSSAGLQRTKRSASITSWTSTGKDTGSVASPGLTQSSDSTRDTDSTIAPTPTSFQDSYKFSGTFDRNTDSDMETLLKDMYNAIKSQQILQPTASTSDKSLLGGSPHIARTGSRRGSSSDRLNTLKRGSIRGLQSLIVNNPHGPSPYSSNSSIDGRISPSPSFGTSTPDVGPVSFLQFISHGVS